MDIFLGQQNIKYFKSLSQTENEFGQDGNQIESFGSYAKRNLEKEHCERSLASHQTLGNFGKVAHERVRQKLLFENCTQSDRGV